MVKVLLMLRTLTKSIGKLGTASKVILCCGVVLCLYAFGSIVSTQGIPLRDSMTDIAVQDELEVSDKSLRLIVVTRVHMKSASSMPDPMKILQFVRSVKSYADRILVCVGADDVSQVNTYIDSVKLLLDDGHEDYSTVTFLPVIPWGHFTTSLNAAILFAQDNKFDRIAYQSVEMSVSKYEVDRVLRRLSYKNTIVVGLVLEGHEFKGAVDTSIRRQKVPLTGRTCPWNTFAMWRVKELALLGFPLIGDGTAEDRTMGGVEELTAITMLQKLNLQYTAVLLRIPPQATDYIVPDGPASATASMAAAEAAMWDTRFVDPQRQQYHDRKMQSKNSRPAAQLKALGIEAGTVLHEIDH